jgi:hypothetical protein
LAGVEDGGGGFRALRNERFHLRPRAVVDGKVMAGLEEVRGHARPHVAESDEADLHGSAPSS